MVATWKANFPSFWPGGARFYAPLAGIAPGEVALLDIPPVPGSPVKLSTGVMVLYADDESFTFMTPEGHTLSAWITFSAHRDGDVDGRPGAGPRAHVRSVRRAGLPARRRTGSTTGSGGRPWRTWPATSAWPSRRSTSRPCASTSKRQWRHAGNVRNSATLRTARHTLTAPVRWITRRR